MPSENEKIQLSVVVPCYNEELGVGEVVKNLQTALFGQQFEILVVDDGSTDKTAEKAQEAGARVLRHPCNRGYGRTLLTGFTAARYPWILMIDGDGSYDPADIAKLLPYAPRFDMVVGARQGSLFWGSTIRAFMRTVYLFLAGFVAGEDIPDANSGLRLFRKEAFDNSMPILCYGYSLSTTMTLSFLKGGRFVEFVPISYLKRQGSSKVRNFRDIPRTLQIMVQVMLYYNPLKFAVCLALLVWALLDIRAALDVFLFGCVLELLSLHLRKGR